MAKFYPAYCARAETFRLLQYQETFLEKPSLDKFEVSAAQVRRSLLLLRL
jgi:hypothetical protein